MTDLNTMKLDTIDYQIEMVQQDIYALRSSLERYQRAIERIEPRLQDIRNLLADVVKGDRNG
jgi:hypothetical protein